MAYQVMKFYEHSCTNDSSVSSSCIYQPSRGHPLYFVFLEVVPSFDCIPSLLSSVRNKREIHDHQKNNTDVE